MTDPRLPRVGPARRPFPQGPPVEAPTLAFFALFLGGVFVLLDGLVLIGAGSGAFGVGYLLPASDAPQLGGLGLALGVGIVATAFLFHENVGQRRRAGVVLLGLSAASLACGGGFLVGFALTFGGALLGLLRSPPLLYPLPPSRRTS